MKIQGQLCQKDYLDAQMLHMKGIVSKRFIVVCMLIILLLLTRGIYEALHGNFDFNYLFPLVFFGALFYFQFVLLSKQAKKIFAQQKSLSAPFEYEFAESGLRMTNEFGESRIPWENFINWKEDENLIVLYQCDNLFNIVPKRFFIDDRQIEEFKGYLATIQKPVKKNKPLISLRILFDLIFILIIIVIFIIRFFR